MDWREKSERDIKRMPEEALSLREEAKEDLWVFAQLVNPGYVYGDIHKEIYRWMMDYNLMTLIGGLEEGPRDVVDNTVNIGLVALAGVLGVLVVIESVLLILRARAE